MRICFFILFLSLLSCKASSKLIKNDIVKPSQSNLEKAESFFKLENYDSAAVYYKKCLEDNPNLSANQYMEIGYTFSRAKYYKEAIQYLSKAIELNPQLYKAYSLRGYAWMTFRFPQNGVDDYQIFLKHNPDDYLGYFNLGNCYEYLSDWKKAFDAYLMSLKNNNGCDECQFKLGLMLGQLGNYQESLKSFDAAINMNPKQAEYYLNRGKVKGRLKLPFCEDFIKAKELGNKDAEVMLKNFCK